MSLSSLVEIIHSGTLSDWTERNKKAFESLFGGADGRYKKSATSSFALRAPGMNSDSGVPFSAYIHPNNPTSGPYSGLSFVLFPVEDKPCLLGLVVGTQGLAPDEAILGRPGHARKAQAICKWLNKTYGSGKAWAKHDPTRTDIDIPTMPGWSDYKSVFDRYGKEIYAVYRPGDNRVATEEALAAFLDLVLEERGFEPMAASLVQAEKIRSAWFEELLPALDKRVKNVDPRNVNAMLFQVSDLEAR